MNRDVLLLTLVVSFFDDLGVESSRCLRISNAQQAACPPARSNRALHGFSLVERKDERPLRKEGGTPANFSIGVELYWLASCVASADGAVVVIRPSSKNQWNVTEKSIEKSNKKASKNRLKIDHKSTKNRWKSRSGGGLGGFSLSSASWEALGRPLRAKSWPTWRQVGSRNWAKINKNSMQKSIKK